VHDEKRSCRKPGESTGHGLFDVACAEPVKVQRRQRPCLPTPAGELLPRHPLRTPEDTTIVGFYGEGWRGLRRRQRSPLLFSRPALTTASRIKARDTPHRRFKQIVVVLRQRGAFPL